MAADFNQTCDRLVTGAQHRTVAYRPMQPTTQHAPTHGGRCTVEYARERELGIAGEALVQFQIPPRGRIHDQGAVALFGAERAQVRQRRLLSFAHIPEERSCRDHRQGFVGAAETGEIAGVELFRERTSGRTELEMPGWPQARRSLRRARADGGVDIGRQKLRRTQPLQLSV